MCHSAVAGMKGSSSRPQSASMRSSARAEVSALELHGPANQEVKRICGARGSASTLWHVCLTLVCTHQHHDELVTAGLRAGVAG